MGIWPHLNVDDTREDGDSDPPLNYELRITNYELIIRLTPRLRWDNGKDIIPVDADSSVQVPIFRQQP